MEGFATIAKLIVSLAFLILNALHAEWDTICSQMEDARSYLVIASKLIIQLCPRMLDHAKDVHMDTFCWLEVAIPVPAVYST